MPFENASKSMSDLPHVPVMMAEVMAALSPRDDEVMIDGTYGAGGYSRAILAAAKTTVIAIDRDPVVIALAMAEAKRMEGRIAVVEDRFSNLDRAAHNLGFDHVDGVVLDVGVSSMQLDQADRGFSFRHDGPLDMRMERKGASAADLVNALPEQDLSRLFWIFGGERRADALARAIVADRVAQPFLRTSQLADLCIRVIHSKPGSIHPATRAFQALRIAVNHELEELANALLAAERILRVGGRLVIVTFHSLEDRIVKAFLADRSRRQAGGSRHAPRLALAPPTFELIHRGAITASVEESAKNPRARSAKLRAARRTAAPRRETGSDFLSVPNFARVGKKR